MGKLTPVWYGDTFQYISSVQYIFFCKNLSGLSALALAIHKGHNISMTKEMFVNKKLYNTVMWEDQADFDMALKVM